MMYKYKIEKMIENWTKNLLFVEKKWNYTHRLSMLSSFSYNMGKININEISYSSDESECRARENGKCEMLWLGK